MPYSMYQRNAGVSIALTLNAQDGVIDHSEVRRLHSSSLGMSTSSPSSEATQQRMAATSGVGP